MIARCTASAAGLICWLSHPCLSTPTPCSPVIVPPNSSARTQICSPAARARAVVYGARPTNSDTRSYPATSFHAPLPVSKIVPSASTTSSAMAESLGDRTNWRSASWDLPDLGRFPAGRTYPARSARGAVTMAPRSGANVSPIGPIVFSGTSAQTPGLRARTRSQRGRRAATANTTAPPRKSPACAHASSSSHHWQARWLVRTLSSARRAT